MEEYFYLYAPIFSREIFRHHDVVRIDEISNMKMQVHQKLNFIDMSYTLISFFWYITKVVSMCSSLLQWAPGSRDLSQDEKRRIGKTEQNHNFVRSVQFWVSFCEFALWMLFSALDKSRDPGAN